MSPPLRPGGAPIDQTPEGLVVVDKPAGRTSHDVVARLRRLAGTRRVGHAGTLDPMATGVLVCGIGRATRLLGHLALSDKTYQATFRLGVRTTTDDAEGEVVQTRPVDVPDTALDAALAALSGELMQVPSSVSAIKVDGKRAYARVRAGEDVELAARPVRVDRFELRDRRGNDLDVEIDCSTGTYVRALARDLGDALGCGASLTTLRRTRVGPFEVSGAAGLDALAAEGTLAEAVLPLAEAVASTFRRRDVGRDEARDVRYGRRLGASGVAGPVGVFDPDGALLALMEDRDGAARPLVVFAPA